MKAESEKVYRPRWHWFSLLPSAFCLLPLVTGCKTTSSTTQPAGANERADKAISDPFNYSPWENKKSQQTVSGGGVNELDKDALKKDLDHVLNP